MFTCHDISENQKGDQGGGPKMAKISGGVKPDIFKITDLSLPEYVIKKGRLHGHQYGKKPGDNEYHLADQLKKKCKEKEFQ